MLVEIIWRFFVSKTNGIYNVISFMWSLIYDIISLLSGCTLHKKQMFVFKHKTILFESQSDVYKQIMKIYLTSCCKKRKLLGQFQSILVFLLMFCPTFLHASHLHDENDQKLQEWKYWDTKCDVLQCRLLLLPVRTLEACALDDVLLHWLEGNMT